LLASVWTSTQLAPHIVCVHSQAPAAEHTSPDGHPPQDAPAVPHDDAVSAAHGTHAPLALQHPCGHEPGVHTHCPPAHACPAAHALPHAPQLASSDERSRHPPEHAVSPGAHAQLPCPPQTWFAPHALHAAPPVPQLATVSAAQPTHWPALSQHPCAHDVAVHSQCPAEHTCPAEHATPHPPQFAASPVTSTHAPPHAV
jgi:hypothetical protein